MTTVQQDFQSRVVEIETYFDFVKRTDEGNTLLVSSPSLQSAYSSTARDDLLRTFRASAILILYNLMESTVTNAIEAVYDELETQRVHFDDCRAEVRQVVLTNLKQHSPSKITKELQRLSTDIIVKTFRKDKIVSGNVDALSIQGLAREYGISHPTVDGSDLLTVKTTRNDLAHGSKSFASIGRDFTMEDILRIKNKVIAYLTAMLANVAAYIQQQHYRATAAHP